ncbi:MAG: hypothetical protein ACKO5Z_00575 [Burkholderiaceae bacterium]
MKQRRVDENNWQGESESPGRRRLRRLLNTIALIAIATTAYITGVVRNWVEIGLLTLGIVVLVTLWRHWSEKRGLRRWRRDGDLVVPSLPTPVSRIPVELEWRWASSLFLRVPLALGLIAALYWAIVLNALQLPAHWLFAVALLAILNLWCWSEPLLLVLIVVPGVLLLALIGWLIEMFSLAGAIGVLIVLAVILAIAVAEIRKRFFGNPPSQ